MTKRRARKGPEPDEAAEALLMTSPRDMERPTPRAGKGKGKRRPSTKVNPELAAALNTLMAPDEPTETERPVEAPPAAEPVEEPEAPTHVREGRPTCLTPAKLENLINAVRLNMPLEYAAAYAGIAKSTLFRWLREGARLGERLEAGDALTDEQLGFVQFSDSMKSATAQVIAEHLQNIDGEARSSWQAAAWMLERRHPEHFALRVKQDHSFGSPEDAAQLLAEVTGVSADVILDVLRGQGSATPAQGAPGA